jgi:hypothetical protein
MSLRTIWRLRTCLAATMLALAVLAVVLGTHGVWAPWFAAVQGACALGLAFVFLPVVRLPAS